VEPFEGGRNFVQAPARSPSSRTARFKLRLAAASKRSRNRDDTFDGMAIAMPCSERGARLLDRLGDFLDRTKGDP
jgi:hypothetical protein